MSATAPLPPSLGRYQVVSRFAMGGMAELFLGKLVGPSGFERAVVIKRILPHFAQHPSFVQMFLDEGRLAARIGHPNVVQVHELAQDGDDLYLVMEYLQGESMAGVQRRLQARARRLEPALAAHVVACACAGLHAAHELTGADGRPLELVHRDMSPQNIFLGYDGTVKVLDFGVAKAKDRISQTEQGTLKGKAEYMSPEQARGKPIDRRSDVFALGTVLYEALTQRRLFRRANAIASLAAVCTEPIAPPSAHAPGLPPELDAICLKALEREPEARYQTAQALRRALLDWLRTSPEGAAPEDALAELMRALYADRIADKGRVVAELSRGMSLSMVPAGEVDMAIELPSVIEPLTAPSIQRPRRWLRLIAGALVAVVSGAAVAIGIAVSQPKPVPVVAQPAPEAAPAAVVAVAPVPAREKVAIWVESAPAGASVLIDGERRGTTPVSIEIDRSSAPAAVRLERPGHEPVQDTVVPDVPQRLKYSLKALKPAKAAGHRGTGKVAPAPAPEPRPPPPEPEKQPDEGKKFRRFN